MSVIAKAHELAKALKESDEWVRLERAREEISSREAAKIMLRDFNAKQLLLYQKQLQGQEPTEQEINELQTMLHNISFNPYVREFLEAEQALGALIQQVQEILSQALGIGSVGDDGESISEPTPREPKQTSKLWTP
ncbi:MAG: YlbF family regulator [Firmicutes bacterium]|nr:YlbF family regulator [Bacillota bacterium]